MLFGTMSLPLSLFVVQDYVGLGAAGLAVLLSGPSIFVTMQRRNAGVGLALVSLLLGLAAVFLAAGSYLLKQHEKQNRALLEKAQAAQLDAAATLAEAKQRQAKAEEAPRKAEELLKKAKEAEEKAEAAPKKAEALLRQAQEAKANADILQKKAAADQARADETLERAGHFMKDAKGQQREAAAFQRRVAAEREQNEALLKQAKEKHKQAEELLLKVQKALEQAVRKLRSDNPEERIRIAKGLARLGKLAAGTERALCEVLVVDPVAEVKEQAADALEKVRPDLAKPVLTLVLPAENANFQGYTLASATLAKMGKSATAATPIVARQLEILLRALLSNATPKATLAASLPLAQVHIQTLAKITVEDPAGVEVLGKAALLKGPNPQLAALGVNALSALGEIAAESPKSARQLLPHLLPALKDPRLEVRLLAITALGKLGAEAKEAIPALREIRFDQAEAVRNAVRAALSKIQP